MASTHLNDIFLKRNENLSSLSAVPGEQDVAVVTSWSGALVTAAQFSLQQGVYR